MTVESQTGFGGLPANAPLDVIIAFINRLLIGRLNATAAVTLTASAGTTTVTDHRIGPNSFIGFMPTTANAAAEIGNGTLYVSARTKGSATLTHANNVQTDRSYRVLLIG